MKGEKMTSTLVERLNELIQALKKSPYNHDAEVPQSISGVIWEIQENLTRVGFYAEDWRKAGYLAKK